MKTEHLILDQGQDVQKELFALMKEKSYSTITIFSYIGLLRSVCISFDGENFKKYEGYLGIAQLSDIIQEDKDHLHISVFAEDGNAIVGHLNKEAIVEEETHVVIGVLE